MEAFRQKFSGTQKDRNAKPAEKKQKKEKKQIEVLPFEKQAEWFNEKIDLKVAKIIKVENNPESDKLYIETLDDGSGTERIIQSGLRDFLKPEELLGKHIILASNLAPRKMRGVESRGMLLAADYKDENGKDCVEPLEAPWAIPGTKVVLECSPENSKAEQIQAEDFFAVEIKVLENKVQIGGKSLTAAGKQVSTVKTKNGNVH